MFYELILTESLDPTKYPVFQSIFGAIFTVMIALEFKRSILVATERRDTVFQVQTVVLIALLAVLRKFIIIDFDEAGAGGIRALSIAALALGGVYWFIRRLDEPSRNSGE